LTCRYIELVTTSNYSAVANSRTHLITAASSKSLSVLVCIRRCSVMVPNNEESSVAYVVAGWLPSHNSSSAFDLQLTDHIENAVSDNAVSCVRICCRGNVSLEPLLRNGRFIVAPLFRHSGVVSGCSCGKIFFKFAYCGVESSSTRHSGHLMAYCVSPG
jgi:hypothetical protein